MIIIIYLLSSATTVTLQLPGYSFPCNNKLHFVWYKMQGSLKTLSLE